MAATPVQNSFGIHTIQVPGSVTLSSAPTAGNWIIAILGVNIDYPNIVIDTTKWKLFDAAGSWRFTEVAAGNFGARCHLFAVYRKVIAGDGAALPAFCTSGTTYWTHAIWEVSGLPSDWETALLFSFAREDQDIKKALPNLPTVAAGSLALTCVACYNGAANPTISGSWTLDFAGNNAANFGNLGAASRQISAAGTQLDGTWTPHEPGGGNPYAGICLVLTTAAPDYRYPRHSFSTQSDNSPTGAGKPTAHLPWDPVVGNLMLAYLFWNSTPDPTINTTDWTILDTLTHSSADFGILLGRYVQSGDTGHIPDLSSTVGTHHGIEIFEVESVSGTFAEDVISVKHGYQDNATPFVTTADTSARTNSLAMIGYGERGSTGNPSVDSAWAMGAGSENNGALGAVHGYCEIFPTAGSSVQATITPGASSLPQGYIQALFGGSLHVGHSFSWVD